MTSRPDLAPVSLLRPLLLTLAVVPTLAGCPAPREMPESMEGETETDGAADDTDPVDPGAPGTTGAGDDSDDDDAETGDDDDDDETGADDDDDNDDDDDDDDDDDGTSTGAEPSCEDNGGACAPDFPEDWEGPVILRPWVDGQPVECDGDYDITVADELGYELTAVPAACTCECEAPVGGACEGEVEVARTTYIGPGQCWVDTETVAVLEPNEAAALNEASAGNFALWIDMPDDPDYVGGSCEYSATTMVEDATFAEHFTLCASDAPAAGACEFEGSCMPTPEAPAEAALCIWAPGDLACPSGWGYADKTLGYDSVDDTRDCTQCDCGEPAGECLDGAVFLQAVDSGTGAAFQIESAPDGDCSTFPPTQIVTQAVWAGIAPTDDVGCEPQGGEPTGTVVPADAVTVCCHGL